ncbi:unnamed protein product [Parnassius mnemosyne]|uniref:Chitin-binding type-2 domain-containing protein n=1 Tax=Parnassius mnemosyne TaxID=213953 RepID=A0AAV1LFB3_9NEOP
MRWRCESFWKEMDTRAVVLFTLLALGSLQPSDGARRTAQRRRDSRLELDMPAPSAESLQAIAQVMGAAGFETYTEGKALVKRLIPNNSQPDLDVVEHQGIIGKAGVDFPAFPSIPNTGFNCKNVPTGYYADLETDCQVFHICDTSRKISFLCPNGTIFSQSHLICDWWFKVDCASAPALYESSAEYYSNEQKKTQRTTQSPTKIPELQQISENNIRTAPRRAAFNIPSTTERLLRYHQRLQSEVPANSAKPTSKSFQTLFPEINTNPTQKTQATTTFEKRRKNLVQLIANNFVNLPKRTTLPAFELSTRRSTTAEDYIGFREMQIAAETASFAQNQNRQFLQEYSKPYRPYPVYTPNLTSGNDKTKTNPTLTTLYDFRDRILPQFSEETTTKRATLLPYDIGFTEANNKQEPYTRPGVSTLKDFLEKERNKTFTTTELPTISETSTKPSKRDSINEDKKLTIETKSSFESVTMIPDVAHEENEYIETSSSDKTDTYTTNHVLETTEPTYTPTLTEKYYGNLPNRPGLIVPPSLTPKTLHSLAIYYATGLDNFATTPPPEEVESTTATIDEYEAMEDGLPALFSRQTVNKYSNLFRQDTNNSELLEELKLDANGTYNELARDLSTQMSQYPLVTSPQIRELAQVFTHALSAYLQDPVQFRKVLSDIRPTPPNFGDMLTTDELLYNTEPTTTVNEDDQEILGFSDDHKARSPLTSLREGKSVKLNSEYISTSDTTTTTSPVSSTTDIVTTSSTTTTAKTPFRCCGRITASYTSAAPPKEPAASPISFTNDEAVQVNLSKQMSDVISTTENSYSAQRYGGFQNNVHSSSNSQYGEDVSSGAFKPLNDYTEITNLPSAWGVDATLTPVTNGNIFESKRIKFSTNIPITTPVYFTKTESIELENEEELQRAHSQSFVSPQSNSIRQGKQLNLDGSKGNSTIPSENLEVPTPTNIDTTTTSTTTIQPTTTVKDDTESQTTSSPTFGDIFTSPDSDKATYQLPTTFENWQSTMVVDPITLNDGLSSTGSDQNESDSVQKANPRTLTTTTTFSPEYTEASYQTSSSTIAVELSTLSEGTQERYGRLLKDSPTETPQELTTIADTVVEKAKEIMGGMNTTTAEKLVNVMMKTKSKTVRRLILLLIQTCDDDHNSTAEASKRALLEALMAVSQKDMEDVAKEQSATEFPNTTPDYKYIKTTVYSRSMDIQPQRLESNRQGKSINFDASAINSLSQPTTTEGVKTEETEVPTTLSPPTTVNSRKILKKVVIQSSLSDENSNLPVNNYPEAQARVASQVTNLKASSDTRALELLRSLYTIAARWG